MNYPAFRTLTCQQFATKRRKAEISRAGYQIIGLLHDALLLPFMTHLRAANHQNDFRFDGFEQGDQPGTLFTIPDIDTQPDNAGIAGQQPLRDIDRPGFKSELVDFCLSLVFSHIGKQAAQSETGVNVAGIDRGKDNLRHIEFMQSATIPQRLSHAGLLS